MKRMTATTSHLVGTGMYAFAPSEITFRAKSTSSLGASTTVGILGTRYDKDIMTLSIVPFAIAPCAISVPTIINLGKLSRRRAAEKEATGGAVDPNAVAAMR
jgi:hypothetical protein